MSGYLLDSNILIWYLRGQQDAVGLVQRLSSGGDVGVSAVSVLEVQAGVKSGEEERTDAFLEGLTCFVVDRETARQAGSYIRAYRSRGTTLDFADSLVAATAILHDLTLVTKNVSHYPMPEIRVLGKD